MRSNAFTATMEKYIFGEGSCAFLGGSDLWPLLLFPVDPGSPLNPGTPRIYKRGRSAQRFQTPLWIYVNTTREPRGSIPKNAVLFFNRGSHGPLMVLNSFERFFDQSRFSMILVGL